MSFPFPEPRAESQADHAKNRFLENAARHFRSSFRTVLEDNRNFHNLETKLVDIVLHLNLEAVTHMVNLVKINGFERGGSVAFEAGRGVMNRNAQHNTYVG